MIKFKLTRLKLFCLSPRNVALAVFAAFITGAGLILFLIEFDHYTSTEAFCTNCHSMELVAAPYRESAHYKAPSGVPASCGHCHVSEGVLSATVDHILGTKDVIKQIFGPDYDDPVVNALHTPEAAFTARRWFKENDSATCRRCHDQDRIVGTRPDTLKIHREEARAKGKTCIDCHINLVHRKVPGEKTFKRDAWNKMIETEFDLEPGSAARILAED